MRGCRQIVAPTPSRMLWNGKFACQVCIHFDALLAPSAKSAHLLPIIPYSCSWIGSCKTLIAQVYLYRVRDDSHVGISLAGLASSSQPTIRRGYVQEMRYWLLLHCAARRIFAWKKRNVRGYRFLFLILMLWWGSTTSTLNYKQTTTWINNYFYLNLLYVEFTA